MKPFTSLIFLYLTLVATCKSQEIRQDNAGSIESTAAMSDTVRSATDTVVKTDQSSEGNNQILATVSNNNVAQATNQAIVGGGLEARMSERNFIKDIVDRLHALDADIGKLLYNSTSMYAPDDQAAFFKENQPKGGERFTEVLADLDSLQDEVSTVKVNRAH